MTRRWRRRSLYASRRSKRGHRRIAEPDWASVHRELKRKHVTLLILWDEYIAANPDGYSYSRYVAARLMWVSLHKSVCDQAAVRA
jgi:transposase